MALSFVEPRSEAEMASFRQLNWDYRAYLMTQGDEVRAGVKATYSVSQFEAIMATLDQNYRPPKGMMRLALLNGEPVGCGTLQTIAPGDAEIKRVFITDAARGAGAGQAIMQQLITDARGLGFNRIFIDTGKPLTAAIALYNKIGFQPRGPYQDVPDDMRDLLVFFQMDLTKTA